jgi:hypothetical protein
MSSQSLTNVILPFILIAFLMYRRVKRSIGFQKYSPKRMMFRIVFFSLVGFIILLAGVVHPILFLADVVGLAVGSVLAYYAIRHFVYEWRGELLFTRTHIYIEATVLTLFLGRVLYRILTMVMTVRDLQPISNDNQTSQYIKDPYTVAIFFVIIAYYILYYSFLIRKANALLAEKGRY